MRQLSKGKNGIGGWGLVVGETRTPNPEPRLVDLRGVLCPMNYLKARMALEEANPRSLFEFLLDDEEGIRDVPKSLREDGYSILSSKMESGVLHLEVAS